MRKAVRMYEGEFGENTSERGEWAEAAGEQLDLGWEAEEADAELDADAEVWGEQIDLGWENEDGAAGESLSETKSEVDAEVWSEQLDLGWESVGAGVAEVEVDEDSDDVVDLGEDDDKLETEAVAEESQERRQLSTLEEGRAYHYDFRRSILENDPRPEGPNTFTTERAITDREGNVVRIGGHYGRPDYIDYQHDPVLIFEYKSGDESEDPQEVYEAHQKQNDFYTQLVWEGRGQEAMVVNLTRRDADVG